jgi:hypothetical protein
MWGGQREVTHEAVLPRDLLDELDLSNSVGRAHTGDGGEEELAGVRQPCVPGQLRAVRSAGMSRKCRKKCG